MATVLTVLLVVFCVQGLVKFAVGFLVPYNTRIRRIASYYERGGQVINVYDTVTLVVLVVLVILLLLTGMQYLSFVTGLVVGMLTIQVFFHRFSKPLPPDRAPESPRTAAEADVLRHPGQPRPRLARDRLHDRLVRLGPVPPDHRWARRIGPLPLLWWRLSAGWPNPAPVG